MYISSINKIRGLHENWLNHHISSSRLIAFAVGLGMHRGSRLNRTGELGEFGGFEQGSIIIIVVKIPTKVVFYDGYMMSMIVYPDIYIYIYICYNYSRLSHISGEMQ